MFAMACILGKFTEKNSTYQKIWISVEPTHEIIIARTAHVSDSSYYCFYGFSWTMIHVFALNAQS